MCRKVNLVRKPRLKVDLFYTRPVILLANNTHASRIKNVMFTHIFKVFKRQSCLR